MERMGKRDGRGGRETVLGVSLGTRQYANDLNRLIEMQAIVIDRLENFRFAIPDDKPEIIRALIYVLSSMIKGRMQDGVQIPLHVTPL